MKLPQYQLSAHLRYYEFDPEEGVLLDGNGITPIRGGVYVQTLKALQSQPSTAAELMETLSPDFPPHHVLHSVNVLEERKLIHPTLVNQVDERTALTSIELPSIKWFNDDQPVVQVITDLNTDVYKTSFRNAFSQGKSWVPVIFDEQRVFIGPLFKPGVEPCPECLEFRLKHNRPLQSWVSRNYPLGTSYEPSISSSLLNSALEELKALAGSISGLSVLTVVNGSGITKHNVFARPECNFCGDGSLVKEQMESPVRLEPDQDGYDYTVGYRTATPEQTWERLNSRIDPFTGVIAEMTDLSDSNTDGMYVFRTVYPAMPMMLYPRLKDFVQEAYGKGRTPVASKVSAVCEAIERGNARFHGNEPIIRSTLQDLENTIRPDEIQHFHKHQIENPNLTHALGAVPRKFSSDETMEFLPAWSLRDQERRYIPLDSVLYGQPKRGIDRVGVFESNGLSAGNTLNEAVTQGFFELIERDATAIWWYNKLAKPPFDTACMDEDVWFQSTIKELNKNCSVHFLDLTIDTAVTVVAAVGVFDSGYLIGYGCHIDPRLAASRSMTELIQIKTLMKPVAPPAEHADVEYLFPSASAKRFPTIGIDLKKPMAVQQIVKVLVDKMSDLDMDTIVVNLTRPDIDFLPVVKMIVPGLRSFRPRFGSGRLYRVPVELGLQTSTTDYNDLNPLWLTIQPYKPKGF